MDLHPNKPLTELAEEFVHIRMWTNSSASLVKAIAPTLASLATCK